MAAGLMNCGRNCTEFPPVETGVCETKPTLRGLFMIQPTKVGFVSQPVILMAGTV